MTNLKAIETRYKGYRFRSRLEARWAVFFDALELEWEYEPEGYHLPGGQLYLPDFRIDGSTKPYFFECKPDRQLTEIEIDKCIGIATEYPIAICTGKPELPRIRGGKLSGSWATMFWHTVSGPKDLGGPCDPRPYCWHERTADGSFLLWPVPAMEPVGDDEPGIELFIPGCDTSVARVADPLLNGRKSIDSPRLRVAYDTAAGARFEHGEKI